MFVEIDRNSTISIKKQLYDALTYKILNKELPSGHRMPSSRQLADQLNIARNTVTEIYDQLVAESYLNTYQGKGTYVAQLGDCRLCCIHGKESSEKEAIVITSYSIHYTKLYDPLIISAPLSSSLLTAR